MNIFDTIRLGFYGDNCYTTNGAPEGAKVSHSTYLIPTPIRKINPSRTPLSGHVLLSFRSNLSKTYILIGPTT
jgi:hypothetical protein